MKYKCMCVIMALAALGAVAQQQDSLGGYTSMEIEAGTMKGNFATGAIEEMSGGVRIRLLSDDPSLEALPIQANTMRFTWTEGSTTPTMIIMERQVRVQHPDALITAERAEWDFNSGRLVFSGDPTLDREDIKGVRGEKMILNLQENTFEVTRFRADQVPLQISETAPRAPTAGIREQDITDWHRLIDAIKGQAGTDAPSPGRQIIAQMSEQNVQLLLNLETALLVERKADMVRLINDVLSKPGLYSEAAWAGIALPGEAQALLAEEHLDAATQTKLNRMLLQAAYPFAFVN